MSKDKEIDTKVMDEKQSEKLERVYKAFLAICVVEGLTMTEFSTVAAASYIRAIQSFGLGLNVALEGLQQIWENSEKFAAARREGGHKVAPVPGSN